MELSVKERRQYFVAHVTTSRKSTEYVAGSDDGDLANDFQELSVEDTRDPVDNDSAPTSPCDSSPPPKNLVHPIEYPEQLASQVGSMPVDIPHIQTEEFSDEAQPAEELFDPWCDPANPQVIQFQDISAAAFKIKSGIMMTPCTRSHISSMTGCHLLQKGLPPVHRQLQGEGCPLHAAD